ncbi:MAG: hypothetical protein Q7J54_01420 [Candidatus Woesearchaeota archaeon]|nr:hypothetical protein [Candidatus Woesearchaeota archaeon]
MEGITREAIIGDFVATYRQIVKPLLERDEIETARIPVEDLVIRYSLYLSTFDVGSGGSPEAHYRVAIGSLQFLISEIREPEMFKRVLKKVDAQIGKIDLQLSGNEDYRMLTKGSSDN